MRASSGEAGIPSYGDEEPVAAPAASRAEVSDGVRSTLRDVDEERAETVGTGTAARSPHDACRGSCKGLTGVDGTGSTDCNRAEAADVDDVKENVCARGKV